MERVLVVAAHPDDEVLGAGCAIAMHAAKGDDVFVYIATDGANARLEKGYDKKAEQLRKDCVASCKLLGVAEKNVFFGEFVDQSLDVVKQSEVAKAVSALLERTKASVVYTHSAADINKDHRLLFEAVCVACRPGSGVKTLYSFEVPSSTEWGTQLLGNAFRPTYFIDASKLVDKKISALQLAEQ